ncbi:MAG: HAMP domain-containing histidine kinase [Phycisphaerales bacterium]|nr:HAMP domain-containing histidine kinase [Phycisphaerales bacterium]NNM26430.1 HAMP domain-containing histidine kinase [Phycisphaerales bacterium]
MDPPAASDGQGDALTTLTHHRLLGSRLHLHARVRLAAVAVMVTGALFARYGLGIEQLPVGALVVLAAVVAAYNIAAYLPSLGARAEPTPSAPGHPRIVMHAAIVLDFLALTVAVWLVGGARSPFIAFYLLHVILSCLLLTRREAITIACLAYGLVVTLVVGEWQNVIPPRLPPGAVAGTEPFDGRYAVTVLAVYGLLMAVTVFLVTTLATRLRAGERDLQSRNVELGRRSSLRRDFLHMALHDVQAPVGVVTTSLRNMAAGIGGTLSEHHATSVERSLRRLDQINQFLAEFRKLEALESEPLADQVQAVDVEALLDDLVEAYRDQADHHGHTLEIEVQRKLPAVRAIPALLREAVANYLSNAIKYTPDGGRIVLRAHRRAWDVCIEVEDNGIGIAAEDQKKLFTEFTRIDHRGTPIEDVRGTGLGLSIVRRIIERQGGVTGVRSTLGKGSTFSLHLPAADHVISAPPA